MTESGRKETVDELGTQFSAMEISWLITAVLAITMVYFIHWLKERHINYFKKQGIPLVSGGDVSFKFILDLFIFQKNMFEFFSSIYKNLGGEKFGGYFQFFTPIIIIRDTEIINQVLIKDFTHFEDRGPPQEKSSDLFGLSMFGLCGDEWRAARHKLTPTFTSGKLKMMFEPIKECCNEGVLFLKDKIGQDMEARSLMGKFILKIIANISFGISIDTFNEKEAMQNEFVKAASNFFKPSVVRLLKGMAINSFPKIRKILRFKLLDDDVNNFFQKITKDIIKAREESNMRRNDFLQIMLDEKKKEQALLKNHDNKLPSYNKYEKEDEEILDQLKNTPASNNSCSTSEMFTEEFIAAQTFLFISGGSETTSNALNFVLFELAINQDVQKEAKKEINNSILSSKEFNYQTIKKMVYLEQIIYETLRLHSISPMLGRYCTKDYTIPGTKIIIEKGTTVMIPAGFLQNDPQYFPDPLKFNPDRFKNMETVPKGVFFPFGSGPRICIAMRLAMLKMKIVLATLLLNYTVTLSEKTKLPLKMIKNSFFNHVEGGIWIKFEKDSN